MTKLNFAKGYTLLETIVVLAVLSFCTLISFNTISFSNKNDDYIDSIVETQFKAIMDDKYKEYEDDYVEIYFSHLGNVNRAQSFEFNDDTYIVSLGTGRVYIK